ncbi:MAG: hypothetical protein ACXVEV_15515 [Nocardioidaceae bacterium]
MDNLSDLLMRYGVAAACAECGDERIFLPVEPGDDSGAFCCTRCDAAVFLLPGAAPGRAGRTRVA